MFSSRAVRSVLLCAVPVLFALGDTAFAAKRPASKSDDSTEVDFFAAKKAGDIEVKVVAKDSTGGNVLIKNKSGKPLSIRLPEAFVGVPVAAQFGGMGGMGMGGMGGGMGGMGMGGMGGGMGGMGGMNQSMGGGMGMGGMGGGMGMGGMGGGMGGMGMGGMGGGGMFRVEPEKVGKLKIVTVCLEHGKKDPTPRIEYDLIPVESYTKNKSTIEAVKMLARGEVDQRSAQAAVWNTENGKSWEELSVKVGAKHLNGTTEAYFTASHIERGMQIVGEAERRSKETKPAESPTTSAQK